MQAVVQLRQICLPVKHWYCITMNKAGVLITSLMDSQRLCPVYHDHLRWWHWMSDSRYKLQIGKSTSGMWLVIIVISSNTAPFQRHSKKEKGRKLPILPTPLSFNTSFNTLALGDPFKFRGERDMATATVLWTIWKWSNCDVSFDCFDKIPEWMDRWIATKVHANNAMWYA